MIEDVNNITIIGAYHNQPTGYKAFIPNDFPPKEFSLVSPKIAKLHTEAVRLLGKLDGITVLLPDKDYFLEMFVRKDASASSQIEGTKATMMDAMQAANIEPSSDIPDDVDDILHYIAALNYGIERIDQLPLSLRLLKELHKKLMVGARKTHHAYPGQFRTSQNWIGGTRPDNARFVPPPVYEMQQALGHLEKFMHAEDEFLPLIKAGLMHAQFETIHPFADGNGRTGRMLVTIYLWKLKLLGIPVLYLSSYFKKHQELYYERLHAYHSQGTVALWLEFFLEGIIATASSAIEVCEKITMLRERDMEKVHQLGKVAATTAVIVLRNLYKLPVVGIADVTAWTGYTRIGAYKVIQRLEDAKILYPHKQARSYRQKYVYRDYIALFYNEK